MSSTISAGDTAWVLISTALVLLMMPGLAFFYGGLVRSRSSLNTLMMTLASAGIVTVQWVLVGYTFSFDTGSPLIGGLRFFGLANVGLEANTTYAATIPHGAFVAFQAMFAAITVALISGAVIERIRFGAWLVFALAWTTLVYDPLAHWVWGEGGWLRALGALDFAGGTVVHVSAGSAALVAAAMLGRRRDATQIPHNVPFTMLGAGLLWFGWFGFNAGSALGASGVAANALLTTHAAAAAALTLWMVLDIWRTGTSTAVGAATGAVVGLVAITPAAGYVTPRAALAIGALAAGASYAAIQLRHRSRIDDALDVFACHGVSGILGAILTGVFATKSVNPAGADGLLAGNASQLWVQLLAVGATIALSGGLTAVILVAMRAVMTVRLPLDQEIRGVDLGEHGEEAYHGGDIGELAGRHSSLGDSVLLPASDVSAMVRSTPQPHVSAA